MKKETAVVVLLIGLSLASLVFAGDFKPYPGAKVEEKATKEARQLTGIETTVYTTGDAFEKVHAFYKALGREYKMPSSEGPSTLRSGGVLKEAYFIFDGAPDISSSKIWIKIQRPYLGEMKARIPANPKYVEDIYDGVQDVTVIVR